MAGNPVLRLRVSPFKGKAGGGGKSEKDIAPEYESRRTHLQQRLAELFDRSTSPCVWHKNRTLLWFQMARTHLVASQVPSDLFEDNIEARVCAPLDNGYVVEVNLEKAELLLARVAKPPRVEVKVDISRIVAVKPLAQMVTPAAIGRAWRRSSPLKDGRRAFVATLPPYRNLHAKNEVIAILPALCEQCHLALNTQGLIESDTHLKVADGEGRELTHAPEISSFLAKIRDAYTNSRAHPRFLVYATRKKDLIEASARGGIVRWDPVSQLMPAKPGLGPEPEIRELAHLSEPIVGVIDGGLTARRYEPQVAWRADPFVPDHELDLKHGNCVAALIVDGHEWNNRLRLPQVYCQVGIVPAVPKSGSPSWDLPRLISYLDKIIDKHKHSTRVWNISANMGFPCDRRFVSEVGHQLSLLARKHRVLLVISSGNTPEHATGPERISPPADCEAALTVAGRMHDLHGHVSANPCPVSRRGKGPEGMLKPELSWFSYQRLLGGGEGHASSYAAPLVSRLAAHTWSKLRDPSPDMVRALLINAADGAEFDVRKGYGSPIDPEYPWITPDNAVIFCWRGAITEKGWYYWEGIRVPESLSRGGVFRGKVRVVCIVEPVTHMRGTNYISNRVEFGLHYQNSKRSWIKLAGSLPTETKEDVAREVDGKWQTIRCYRSVRNKGVTLANRELRLAARLFWRDRYLYPASSTDRAVNVTFVVTLESLNREDKVYHQFFTEMGQKVENATFIEVDVESDADADHE